MAIFLSIPFAILLATFDVVVKVQYFENWSYTGMALKAIKSAPGNLSDQTKGEIAC
jgi:hypothetical protein